jgi:hypothetical protein
MKYLLFLFLGFAVAVFAESQLSSTALQTGCYQDGSRIFRTDAWIHQSSDPAHTYYPVGAGVKIVHSYAMWFESAKHIPCDKMIDGNKK